MNIIDTALYYNDELDRRQIKTKKAIYAAFFSLLKEKDISKITITELSKRAEIDRKTFYLHYSCIADIYNELGNTMVGILKNTLADFSETGIVDTPYELFMTINEILTEKFDLIREVIANNDFTSFVFEFKDIFCEELIKIYEQSELGDSERFKLKAEFIASGTVCMYLCWLKGESAISMDELALLASSMIAHGVSGMQ